MYADVAVLYEAETVRLYNSQQLFMLYKLKSMQRSGTEAIRIQFQPSKPKREITKTTNSKTTKRTYGQPSVQLLLKR